MKFCCTLRLIASEMQFTQEIGNTGLLYKRSSFEKIEIEFDFRAWEGYTMMSAEPLKFNMDFISGGYNLRGKWWNAEMGKKCFSWYFNVHVS